MQKDINWSTIIFIITYHLALFITLPLYLLKQTPSSTIIGWTIFLFFATGMGITIAYHRLYSHRAYELNPIIQSIVLFFGTMAAEGSALWWSRDHRLHHQHVDTEKDPYSVKKSFTHAHILWLFKKTPELKQDEVQDLQKNKLLQFQHKHYFKLYILANLATTAFVGWIANDYLGALIFTYLLRTFLVHHCTWFINSAAHYWGSKTFSREHTAVNNAIIALFTYGEGYHNYHHTFASDYRNGVRWWQFDPTKWTIWTLSKIGLARKLKIVSPYLIKRKIIQEKTRQALERLEQREQLAQKLNETAEKIHQILTHINDLIRKYQTEITERKILREQIKIQKYQLKNHWKQWAILIKTANSIAQ